MIYKCKTVRCETSRFFMPESNKATKQHFEKHGIVF